MSANKMPVQKEDKQGKKGRQKGTKMKTFTRPRQGATYDLAKSLLKPLARAAAYETRGDSLLWPRGSGRGREGERRGVASSSSCCFGACKLLAMNRLNRMNQMNSIQLNWAPNGVWVWVSDWVRIRARVVASLMRKFMMMIMTVGNDDDDDDDANEILLWMKLNSIVENRMRRRWRLRQRCQRSAIIAQLINVICFDSCTLFPASPTPPPQAERAINVMRFSSKWHFNINIYL